MILTKLAIAEREIVAAVRLLFGGGDPIAVCLLVSAARDTTGTLCAKRGVDSSTFTHIKIGPICMGSPPPQQLSLGTRGRSRRG